MLVDHGAAIMCARSRDEFRHGLICSANDLGFDTVSAIVVTDQAQGGTAFAGVHNTPPEYLNSQPGVSAERTRTVRCHDVDVTSSGLASVTGQASDDVCAVPIADAR